MPGIKFSEGRVRPDEYLHSRIKSCDGDLGKSFRVLPVTGLILIRSNPVYEGFQIRCPVMPIS